MKYAEYSRWCWEKRRWKDVRQRIGEEKKNRGGGQVTSESERGGVRAWWGGSRVTEWRGLGRSNGAVRGTGEGLGGQVEGRRTNKKEDEAPEASRSRRTLGGTSCAFLRHEPKLFSRYRLCDPSLCVCIYIYLSLSPLRAHSNLHTVVLVQSPSLFAVSLCPFVAASFPYLEERPLFVLSRCRRVVVSRPRDLRVIQFPTHCDATWTDLCRYASSVVVTLIYIYRHEVF